MATHNFKTPILSIDEAVAVLRSGGLVALPTETVYGLAADASQEEAVKNIFKAKGRPADHPLIVHVASFEEARIWAEEIPAKAELLARHFWPGPLTMVFKKAKNINRLVTGGQETIAVRVPNQKIILEVLRKLGRGVAAPSANRFGRVSPTLPVHVLEELDGLIDGVVDGGSCQVGIESTIVDLTSDEIRLLRPGHISLVDLEKCLGEKVSVQVANAPRVPGLLKAHYAPMTPLKLIKPIFLQTEIEKYLSQSIKINVWSFEKPKMTSPLLNWVQAPLDVKDYAHKLYEQLRAFDLFGSSLTLIEKPSETDVLWSGVLDRLSRAEAHFD